MSLPSTQDPKPATPTPTKLGSNRDPNTMSKPTTPPGTLDPNPTPKPTKPPDTLDPNPTNKPTTPPGTLDPNPTDKPTTPPGTLDPNPTPKPTTRSGTLDPNSTPKPTNSPSNPDPNPMSKPTTSPSNPDLNPMLKPTLLQSIRDPNPTYKPSQSIYQREAENVRNPNPTYPQTTPMDQPDVHPDSALDSAGQNSRIVDSHVHDGKTANNEGDPLTQHSVAARLIDDETATATATSDGNAGSHPHHSSAVPLSLSPADSNDGNPCHQPHAVPHLKSDETASAKHDAGACLPPNNTASQSRDEASMRRSDSDDSLSIQPYAVRYQEEEEDGNSLRAADYTLTGNTPFVPPTPSDDDGDIEPYAVAYMGQGDTIFVKKCTDGSNTSTRNRNDISASLEGCDSAITGANASASAGIDARHEASLNPNPMYWQNALNPNPMYQPNFGQQPTCETNGGRADPVVFGGGGSEPGKFTRNYGVAVSADNEIFVTDLGNQRVQVFSMEGTYLRLFPTVLPAGKGQKIEPYDVAMDGKGHVWAVGYREKTQQVLHAVQYSKNGLPTTATTFDVQHRTRYPSIAVDLRNNNIIVVAATQIFILQPTGSVYRRFGAAGRLKAEFSYVTTDQASNIVVVDTAQSTVHVYDPSGRHRVTFGGYGQGEGKLLVPRGICVNKTGHIFVADWLKHKVDMFTSSGEFARTVVNISYPWGIALGPDGHLVVTRKTDNTVTIFPRQAILTSSYRTVSVLQPGDDLLISF
ncbi:tripartite motif-containing protein 2-like [Branchiostoma floridae]|uniref:Tripartite motif-containing protein 2-like n=1 Tax=Branchiostoma floridae TaxID=7739 RepID=A0A9J7MWX9_BRAFL|nr:tripartite motif-containing protein 2-like [Branchiostoma floridae]